ncbi:unnamed protein product [Allacma fusca]|uniref:Uncharacterized protein n=1 Tax=Allacma fusca TaxID=39272 RepID=A0A8J2JGL4_9HEXA|nr:unnamed protein product [Allacma fusca]
MLCDVDNDLLEATRTAEIIEELKSSVEAPNAEDAQGSDVQNKIWERLADSTSCKAKVLCDTCMEMPVLSTTVMNEFIEVLDSDIRKNNIIAEQVTRRMSSRKPRCY